MPARPLDVVRFMLRNSKRIAISVVGAILVLAGLVLLVLPGPGILVVALGFAVLGTEYAWAAAALDKTREASGRAGRVAKDGVVRAGRGARGAFRSASGSVRRGRRH